MCVGASDVGRTLVSEIKPSTSKLEDLHFKHTTSRDTSSLPFDTPQVRHTHSVAISRTHIASSEPGHQRSGEDILQDSELYQELSSPWRTP